jgi:hypothetical protein
MEQLTHDVIAQVERAASADAGFEETVAALAAALWQTLREQPATHQLLTALSVFALRTPRLQDETTVRAQLQALVSAVVALAGGRLELVAVPTA